MSEPMTSSILLTDEHLQNFVREGYVIVDADLPAATDRLMNLLRIPSISTDPAFKADCDSAAQQCAAPRTARAAADRRREGLRGELLGRLFLCCFLSRAGRPFFGSSRREEGLLLCLERR